MNDTMSEYKIIKKLDYEDFFLFLSLLEEYLFISFL